METMTKTPNKQGFFERRPGLTEIGSALSSRERKRASQALYFKNHPDRWRAILARSYKAHRKARLAAGATWKRDNPEKNRILTKLWRRANRAKMRISDRNKYKAHPEKWRARERRQSAALSRGYVRKLIRKQCAGLLPATAIPESLIKVKTRLIKLKRLCKTQRRPIPETNMTKSSG